MIAALRAAVAGLLLCATGTPAWAWRVLLESPEDDEPGGVAVDHAGDVVVAARIAGRFTVVKLAGSDGAERWRYQTAEAQGSYPLPTLAVDGKGDVVASARIGTGANDVHLIVKLDRTNGTELWRHSAEPSLLNHTLLAPNGDVILLSGTSGSNAKTISRLDGSSGSDRWRKEASAVYFGAVAVDGQGDLLIGENRVRKLTGETGETLWQAQAQVEFPARFFIDPAGDVVVLVDSLYGPPGESTLSFLKLSSGAPAP